MRRYLIVAILFCLMALPVLAQDLAPRAYVITPLHANAVTLAWAYYTGPLSFNGVIPIENAKGTYNIPSFSYYHSLHLFGRSANLLLALPYGVGNFSGEVGSKEGSIYRSGLVDLNMRFSVNLIGGPAMQPKEFAKWKQKKILGTSLRVVAPTGQYDGTKLVNWGINRWAFKPEIGYSQRFAGNWVIDGYAGVWFYTQNPQSFNRPLPVPQSMAPIGSLEGHLSYDFKRFGWLKGLRGWASLDGNFWWGGIASVYNIPNPDTKQTSSRLGATISLPYSKYQSVKVSYSGGTYSRFGGDYKNLQVAWQYTWIGWPK